MIDSETQNNHKPVRAKVVTIRNTRTAKWEVDFEGVVTRRDILRINRILKVEFARAQRRYSIKRKKQIRELEAADRAAELAKSVEKTKSDKITVPSKTTMTSEKVKTKEIVQDA